MTLAPNIPVIPPTITLQEGLNANLRLRELLCVAACVRVSTKSDEQMNSYATQLNYYTKLILGNPD
jgi:hypothetical protein